ncbi:MAG: twitching motility protein PilT [Lachnospiraceae bacterium]|nr:twitching motility protein PilT [Lachnospiraceae bacterium]
MIQIVTGEKGRGKTRFLLGMANEAVKNANGTLVYLDKSTRHMFELDNRVRMINVRDYPVRSKEAFLGFIAGIISQDHDLETIYVDSFLTLTDIDSDDALEKIFEDLGALSSSCKVDFVLSISRELEDLPESLRNNAVAAL